MKSTARAGFTGVVLAAALAGAFSCSKSFESDDDAGGAASGEAGAREQGGASGSASGGRGGTSGNSAGGLAGTSGEAGAGTEPTGGTGMGGTASGAGGTAGGGSGGTGGDEPEGGGSGGPGNPTYRDVILEDEPLVYWRMGIASGLSVPDETGGGNALVLQGTGHALGAPGAIVDDEDTAIGFDGTSSYAIATNPRVFDFTERAPFTLECWARRITGGGGYFQHLLSNVVGVPGSRNGYALWLLPEPVGSDDQRTAFEYDRPSVEVSLWAPVPEAEAWAHYAVAFDGSTATLYVNGTLESSEPIDDGFAARTGPFAVGRNSSQDAHHFRGDVDEVAVYGQALGLPDIIEHYGFAAR